MRVSLRLRVLTLVGTVNVVVFGAGLAYLSSEFARAQLEQRQETARRLVHGLEDSINLQGELRVGSILASPVWEEVADAVIVDRNPAGVVIVYKVPAPAFWLAHEWRRVTVPDGV